MYREYALTLKWVWMCVFNDFQRTCVRVGVSVRERQDTCLRSVCGNARMASACEERLMRDTVESCFFFPPFPCNYCSRESRNYPFYKNTWHIFFQLLDTLPVCQDFNRQVCNRPACKFIHLSDGEFPTPFAAVPLGNLRRFRWTSKLIVPLPFFFFFNSSFVSLLILIPLRFYSVERLIEFSFSDARWWVQCHRLLFRVISEIKRLWLKYNLFVQIWA